MNPKRTYLIAALLTLMLSLRFTSRTVAQQGRQPSNQRVRLAQLVIDPAQLNQYKAVLREETETAAYNAHLHTPHFIKYKTGIKDMVRSL